jgi:phage tail-like protein
MSNPRRETVVYPFQSFNFSVEISVPGISPRVCSAAFAECDGLEMNLEAKTIREGGNNARQIRLPTAVTYGQCTLKRGMTGNFDLWDWFDAVLRDAQLRGSASIVVLAGDGQTERVRFDLAGCLPIKLKAPPLNARDGMVAIEEFQMSYEQLTLKRPSGLGLGSLLSGDGFSGITVGFGNPASASRVSLG